MVALTHIRALTCKNFYLHKFRNCSLVYSLATSFSRFSDNKEVSISYLLHLLLFDKGGYRKDMKSSGGKILLKFKKK